MFRLGVYRDGAVALALRQIDEGTRLRPFRVFPADNLRRGKGGAADFVGRFLDHSILGRGGRNFLYGRLVIRQALKVVKPGVKRGFLLLVGFLLFHIFLIRRLPGIVSVICFQILLILGRSLVIGRFCCVIVGIIVPSAGRP